MTSFSPATEKRVPGERVSLCQLIAARLSPEFAALKAKLEKEND